jgi:hypothetical protein
MSTPLGFVLSILCATALSLTAHAGTTVEIRGYEAEAVAHALQSFKTNQYTRYQGKPVYGDLKHYSVQVERRADHIEVTFVPDQSPLKKNEAGTGGGTAYGWAVTYLISRDGKKILKEHFWK